jgi:uncharacterized protein (TIGR00369 family)
VDSSVAQPPHRHIPFFEYCRIDRPFRGEGRCTARVEITPDLVNGHGAAHGGLLMTLMDACMAGAASSVVTGERAGVITIDMQVQFLSPGYGVLIAEGKVSRGGRSLIFTEGEIRDAKDTVIAKATGLFSAIQPKTATSMS